MTVGVVGALGVLYVCHERLSVLKEDGVWKDNVLTRLKEQAVYHEGVLGVIGDAGGEVVGVTGVV